jgi:hypothetical protein
VSHYAHYLFQSSSDLHNCCSSRIIAAVVNLYQQQGRMGFNSSSSSNHGESYLVLGNDTELAAHKSLPLVPLPPLRSVLATHTGSRLQRALLEVIVAGSVQTRQQAGAFIQCALLAVQQPPAAVSAAVEAALDALLLHRFILADSSSSSNTSSSSSGNTSSSSGNNTASNSSSSAAAAAHSTADSKASDVAADVAADVSTGDAPSTVVSAVRLTPTQLGRATFCAAMSPEEAAVAYSTLGQLRKLLLLSTELHLLYAVTPPRPSVEPHWQRYGALYFALQGDASRAPVLAVAHAVGIEESIMRRLQQQSLTPSYGAAAVEVVKGAAGGRMIDLMPYRRFYAALVLEVSAAHCDMPTANIYAVSITCAVRVQRLQLSEEHVSLHTT